MNSSVKYKFLITGFEPFAGFTLNPTELIVDWIKSEKLEDCQINTAVLPVNTKTVWYKLKTIIEEFCPHVVINLGLSPKRSRISLEKIAINLLDFDMEDNDGNLIQDIRINENSPDAYFSNLPLKLIRKGLQENDIPAKISYSAGTYLCNQVFFNLMDYIRSQKHKILGGFIHVPPVNEMNLPDKFSQFQLPLEQEYEAIKIACKTILQFYKC